MKFNIKRIVSLILALVMCFGIVGVHTFAAETDAQADPSVEIISKNVMYGERYYLMFAADAQNVPAGGSVELVATKNGESSAVTSYGVQEIKAGVEAYVFAVNKGVAAQDIDAVYTATAQIKDADGNVVATSSTVAYSILEYLNERLYVSEGVSADEKTLYSAFIDFAVASEKVLCDGATDIASSVYVSAVDGTLDGVNKGGIYKVGDVITGVTFDIVVEDGYELYYEITEYDAKGNSAGYQEILASEFESFTVTENRTVINAALKEIGTVDPVWTLVTDVNEITVGAQILIVATGSNIAMSTTQNGNNRGTTSVTKNGNTLSSVPDNAQIIIVEAGKTSGTFAFNVGTGYLYAASSSSNYLRTEKTLSANSSWSISITLSGVATIKSTGSYTRNWMRYNSQSTLFSCYSSGQQDIGIYILK